MTIAFDKVTTLALGTGDRSFNHVPVGTPRGVIVYIVDGVGTDQVVGVTYGGAAMTEITGSPQLQSGGEGGSVHAFWLGSSILTGTRSVAIDRNDATNYIAACYTVTADSDTAIQNVQTSTSTSTAAPGGTLVINVPSFVSGALYSGSNNPGSTAPAGTANDITGDFGTDTAAIASDPDIQTANFAFTWSQSADDGTAIVVAMREKTQRGVGQAQAKLNAFGQNVNGQANTFIAYNSLKDDFNRANGAPVGTATFIGGTWIESPNNITLAIEGNRVKFTQVGGSAGAGSIIAQSRTISLNTSFRVTFNFSTIATQEIAMLGTRGLASSSYSAVAEFDGSNNLILSIRAGGTTLTSATITREGTWASTDSGTIAFELFGASPTTLNAKVWKTTNSEPASWDLTTTDSTAGLQQVDLPLFNLRAQNLPTGGTSLFFDDASASNIWWGSGQAQAYIKAQGFGLSQSQADVKAQGFGLGQSQADIKQVGNGLAQAQTYIKATNRGFGQAQTTVKGGNAFAQAQADIKTINYSVAQATGHISGQSVLIDTASTVESNSWGSSDNGLTWSFTTGTAFSKDGSVALITHSGLTSRGISQTQLELNNLEASYDFKVDSLTATGTILVYFRQNSSTGHNAAPASYVSFESTITLSTGVLNLSLNAKDGTGITTVLNNGYITITANTLYTAKLKIINSSDLLNIFVYYKIWEKGTTEPEWSSANLAKASPELYQGAGIRFITTNASGSKTYTFDNIFANPSIIGGAGQAQADIKTRGNGFGQTQAKIIPSAVSQTGQAQTDIKAVGGGSAQSQADIKAVGNGLGQSQADIKAVGTGLGQTQADIKAVSRGLAQANVDIKAINNGLGQAQADIKATTYGLSQTQADIKQSYTQLAQAQAYIKQTYLGLAQVNATIKAVGNGLGQAQTDIKTTYYGLAQTQADIKTTYIQFGQAQANITNRYNQFSQAQVDIKAVGNGLGQAQSDVKATSNGFGQAQVAVKGNAFAQTQAYIKVTNINGFGQSQSDIKAAGFGLGQAQTYIKSINNNIFGQANADIKAVNNSFGQSNADIKQVGYGSGQAQASIRATYNSFGQAQTDVKAVGYGLANTQADIKATSSGLAQAQGDILAMYRGFGQSNANIKAVGNGLGQTQSDIKAVNYGSGQSQTKLNSFDQVAFGQAQVNIRFNGNAVSAQTQAKINAFGQTTYGQSQVDVRATYTAVAQTQTDIKAITNVSGNTQADIKVTTAQHGQSQADIKQTYNSFAQVQGYIKVVGLNGYGQTQADIRATYQGYAQVQAYIKSIGRGYGQTQAYILSGNILQFAQTNAGIKATNNRSAQANAQILQTVQTFAQAQVWVKTLGAVYAQAQAAIRVVVVGQAQADILQTYSKFANAQALIRTTVIKVAQTQAAIKTVGQGTGQGAASITSGYFGIGLALALIVTSNVTFGQAQTFIVKAAGYGQANAQIRQLHELKHLEISERIEIDILLSDRVQLGLGDTDIEINLEVNDRIQIGLEVSDRINETINLSDINY